MATVCGLIIIKEMDYRERTDEEWSSIYWLTGGIPLDDNAWLALANEIVTAEKECYASSSKVIRAYGYNDNTEDRYAVWAYDWKLQAAPIPGTLTSAAGEKLYAGDQAGMVWWRTTRRNSRGKWIYLRKYFHDGFTSSADHDQIGGATNQAYTQFGLKMSNGSLSNGRIIRSQTQDEVITRTEASQWVTTRTLKRRGKRPVPAAPGSALLR